MRISDYNLEDGTPWRLFAPEDAKKDWAVLWLQGFTSTIEGHSEGCIRMSNYSKVTFAMLDFAGHGKSPVPLAEATRKQQLSQVLAVYDELTERGFTKIIVIGGSFGAYLAALIPAQRQPQVIVLRAPANYKDEEFELSYSETIEGRDKDAVDLYRVSIDENYSNNAVESLRAFEGETYILEHEKDSVISSAIPRSYYMAAQRGNHIVIRGLDHSPKLLPNAQEYFDVIEHWLQTIIYVSTKDLDVK